MTTNPTPSPGVEPTAEERAAAHAAAQRKILHRLRRARGQLDAVITAVESGGQ